MLRMLPRAILSFAVLFGIGGCASEAPTPVGLMPPNIRTFMRPYPIVWKAVIDAVRYDFLMNIDVADSKRGYFSTELIRDYQPGQRTKFRISGTLQFDGQGTIVKLYRQLEVEQNDRWSAVPSDLTMEAKILDVVARRLPPPKPPTKKK
jgi:hypothetical protein